MIWGHLESRLQKIKIRYFNIWSKFFATERWTVKVKKPLGLSSQLLIGVEGHKKNPKIGTYVAPSKSLSKVLTRRITKKRIVRHHDYHLEHQKLIFMVGDYI